MEVEFRINGVIKSLDVAANESLLAALRREGYYSVRHGCETGECGACAVLIDGTPRPACVTFAAQVGGCTLATVESLGTHGALHPLQQAFLDTGAVGCGFCAPGMLLSAYALLKRNPSPGEEDVRGALSGNLCRCTGYARPVQAVLRAAAVMRGEMVEVIGAVGAGQGLDAVKLVTGKAAFTDDVELRGLLHARLLTSPHAHAVIRDIDVTQARALPGVHAVLTYRDIARVPYAAAASPAPGAGPRDRFSLDYIVRFAGDRVAAVAAETSEIAEQALRLIQVKYEVLPAAPDPRRAIEPGMPRIHPEAESSGIYDAAHNTAAHLSVSAGNVERGFAESDLLVEGDYIVSQTQQAPIETHIAVTWLDEDDRLVVRASAESAHALQHIIAPLIDLPVRRMRAVTPRVGGSFGAKQGMLVEDICALLTLATRRPVRLEYSRADEFRSSSLCPAQMIHLKTGVKRDGTIIAHEMVLLASAGAYGSHAPALLRSAALNTLPLYPCANMRCVADAVYTNLPPAGSQPAGASQSLFALESHMDEIAKQVGLDALELRRRNRVKAGDQNLLAKALAENGENAETGAGSEHPATAIASCELPQCAQIVEASLGWKEKRGKGDTGRFRRGAGVALAMYSAPGDTGKSGASVRLNEDGSFTVLVGLEGSGDGSETMLAQVAAETLGARLEDIILHTSDTDSAPFESSPDASVSAHVAASAVIKASEQVRALVLAAAGRMLKVEPGTLTLEDRVITALNGDTVTLAQVALHTQYTAHEPPIMTTAVEANARLSPSFAAYGAEVEVDTETGAVRVLRAITALDAGRVVDPLIAASRAEGGAARALGQAIGEEMLYDQHGIPLTTSLGDYGLFSAPDMPPIETHFVEAPDPSSPSGSKLFAAVAADGMAPAIANAVADALGVRVRHIPLTPERVLQAIRMQGTT
jgi:putative selenate reductase molybdopterin-binding subunit